MPKSAEYIRRHVDHNSSETLPSVEKSTLPAPGEPAVRFRDERHVSWDLTK